MHKTRKPKEKLVLRKVYDGMARTGYEDQHGAYWETCWTGGTLDENGCDECGENVSETLVCMDGGEAYCWSCLNKLFDVEYVEDKPKEPSGSDLGRARA